MAVSQYGAAADHAALSGNNAGDPHPQYSMVLVGLAAGRPAAGTAGLRTGTMYFATDTNFTTIYDGTTWRDSVGDARFAALAADNILAGAQSFRDAVELSPRPENQTVTQFEPAGKNYVTNPSFEVDAAGWRNQTSVNGATPASTVVRDTAQFFIGTASLRTDIVSGTGNATFQGPTFITPAGPGTELPIGVPITARWRARFSVSGRNAGYVLRGRPADTASGPVYGLANVTVPTGLAANTWHEFSLTMVLEPGATNLELVAWENRADQGAYSVWIDQVQIERSPVATSYIDGAQGTGYAWTGAAHASTSTRAANTVARRVTDVATTNLLVNPSFETALTPWRNTAEYGGGGVVSRVPGGRVGDWCAQVDVLAAATNHGIWNNEGPTARPAISTGVPYTFSLWARVLGPTPKALQLILEGHTAPNVTGGTTAVAGSVVGATWTVGNEWTRISVTQPSFPAGSTHASLQVRDGASQGLYSFQIDGLQLETGAVATSYADGSLGTGFAWTGTPHASTSTRAAGTDIPAVVRELPPHGLVADGPGRNFLANPSFEIDVSGWLASGGSSATRTTEGAMVGGAAARWSLVAGAVYQGFDTTPNPTPATPGEVWTASIWVKAANAQAVGKTIRLACGPRNASGAYVTPVGVSAVSASLSTGWQRLIHTVLIPAGATAVFIGLDNNSQDIGASVVLVDGAQLERSPSASSYIDGSVGPGYEWEGTPHASPSRRSAGTRVVGAGPPSLFSVLTGTSASVTPAYTQSTALTTGWGRVTAGGTVVFDRPLTHLISLNAFCNGFHVVGGDNQFYNVQVQYALTYDSAGRVSGFQWTISAPFPTGATFNANTNVTYRAVGAF